MNRQHEGTTKSKKKNRKAKKDKVITVGFMSSTLLMAIIAFAICFVVGIQIGPNFPL